MNVAVRPTMNSYPKISIVTPVFNQADYLEATILSVLNQDYPNLEYIIVDGGSTDGTLEIIKRYEGRLAHWISEPDSGMYDALNKGLQLSTGEIMGWINSDDLLLANSFSSLSKIFSDVKEVNWVQGLNSFIDLDGNLIFTKHPKPFSFLKFLVGEYQWIQQESTFWRRSLWEKSGGYVSQDLKLAGDFELWFRFSQYDKLYNISVPLGAWRKRVGQLSSSFYQQYLDEANSVLKSYPMSKEQQHKVKMYKRLQKIERIVLMMKIFNAKKIQRKMNRLLELNKLTIGYSHEKQCFK